ncbi:MAG TPA: hypothetical protein VHY79_00540 [Rhizomicrobium sp.]|jgi:uncharacterized BrkB/YihY/UPF0761 family membrane protein|nr:hypothetical protein [Rhizomicrobium sp.]
MRYGISGLALFVAGVVALVFAQTTAIAAKYILYYTLRLHANAQTLPWMAYAPTMPVVITVVLLVAALYMILARNYSPQDRHWAYGTLGTLVGFWLK